MLMKLAKKLNLCVQQWIHEDPEDLGMQHGISEIFFTIVIFFRISLSQPEIHLK